MMLRAVVNLNKKNVKILNVGYVILLHVFGMGMGLCLIILIVLDLTASYEQIECSIINVEIPVECPSKEFRSLD